MLNISYWYCIYEKLGNVNVIETFYPVLESVAVLTTFNVNFPGFWNGFK